MAGQARKQWWSLAAAFVLVGGMASCDRSSRSQDQVESESQRARGAQLAGSSDWAARPGPSVLSAVQQYSMDGKHSETFSLAMPSDWSDPRAKLLGFNETAMERFVVRLPSGGLDSVALAGEKTPASLRYTYPEQGTMMSSMCVQSVPGSKTKVHYCLKRIHSVGESKDSISSSSSRFGDEAELRPLVPPERVVPGSDLPVMAYLGGQRARGVKVYAFGPKGQVLEAVTGNAGVADLRIDALGKWKVRVAGDVSGTQMVAELEFSNEVGGRL